MGTPRGALLWALWAAATAAGWAAAGLCLGLMPRGVTPAAEYVFWPLSAVGQWLVLRRHFARAGVWLGATVAGIGVAALAYALLQTLPAELVGPLNSGVRVGLSLFIDGLALGVAQWLVLRNNVRGTARWIPAVAAPLWMLALQEFNRGAEPYVPQDPSEFGGPLVVAVTNLTFIGLFIGTLTGAVLAWLVDQPRVWEYAGEDDDE